MEKIISIKLSDGSYIRVRDVKGLEEQTLYYWDGHAYRKLAKRERERLFNPIKKICRGCGKEFIPNGNQRFCSDECKKPRKKPPVKKICDICGQPFVPTYSSQKRCSKECSAEGKRRTLIKCKEEYKTNPVRHKVKAERPLINEKKSEKQQQKDPYAWLDKMNEYLRANGGKYVSK